MIEAPRSPGSPATSSLFGTSSSRHVPVVGDTVAPFMAPPDTDPSALRAIESLAVLPADPAAATEEIQRRREEIGFSYFVVGGGSVDTLAPVVAALAGR